MTGFSFLTTHRKSALRHGLVAGIGFGLTAATTAWAADDAQVQKLEAAIERLEKQHHLEMQQLQDQISQLRAQTSAPSGQQSPAPSAQAATQAPQPVAPSETEGIPTPKLVESPGHQFGMQSADGQNSIAILARLHFDAADYFKTTPDGGANGYGPGGKGGPLQSGANARRARLGIGGTFLGDWAYRLIYDFGNSSDSIAPGVAGATASGVENAYITYRGFKTHDYLIPASIDIGYLDVPWTMDEATSSNDTMFMERATSQVIATAFGGGDFRSGIGARVNNNRGWAALYLTGPQSGTPHTGANIGNNAILARASYQLRDRDDESIHVGVNAGHLIKSRVNSTTTTANGITTTDSYSALALYDRPELRVDPTTILNTGNIPANSGTVAGLEGAVGWGQFFTQAEYYHYWVPERAGGINPTDGTANLAAPTLNFDGGYIEASYSLGGRRHYLPETGAYSGVIPNAPFSLSGWGWGALEIAMRYSAISLNDRVTPGQAPHLTGGVNGGEQQGIDVGFNWYPNRNMRFMLNYVHTDVSKLYKPTTDGTAPSSLAGATIDALALRSQFLF